MDDVTSAYLQQGVGLSIHLNELATALLYGSLQGLCNLVGVLNAHALTKHDSCANCRAKEQGIFL